MNDKSFDNGISFLLGCEACPEGYDVYLDNKRLGYLRVRRGIFSAVWEFGGEQLVLFEKHVMGDGHFVPEERGFNLEIAREAFESILKKRKLIDTCGCHECKNLRLTFAGDYHIFCPVCNRRAFHFLYNQQN